MGTAWAWANYRFNNHVTRTVTCAFLCIFVCRIYDPFNLHSVFLTVVINIGLQKQ